MKKFDDAVITTWYTEAHLTIRQISKLAGMSHTSVWKRLKKRGIKAEDGEWVKLNCSFCGKEIKKTRGLAKKFENHFCNTDCRAAFLENPGYHPWRTGSRLARAIVSQYFPLQPENVVHHKDTDQRNNNKENLSAFKDQSDHMKYHRNPKDKPNPIWDGELIP